MKKWAVYDTASEEMLFPETEEKAFEEHNKRVSDIERQLGNGHKVYIFEVKNETEIDLGELDKKEIGERVKSIRKAGQCNLESFGELAFGASKGTVSNWENGVNIPNKKRLERIAKIGNKTVKWILYGVTHVEVL